LKLFRGVYRYAIPSAFHDFIAILNGETMGDTLNFERSASEEEFYRDYPTIRNRFSLSKDGISKYLLVNLRDVQLTNLLLHNCDSYNGNGTWAANILTSDATNVRNDSLYTTDGTGAIAFDIDVSQSVNNYAEVSISDMSSVDISADSLENIGSITMDVVLSSLPSALTGFTLRFGSSASAYYEITVTSQAGGAAFTAGKNVLVFDWSTVTTPTGSPDTTGIVHLLFRTNYSASMTDLSGIYIDNIQIRQPFIATLLYSSYYLVSDSGNTPKEKTESETDIINIDAPYVDILLEDTLRRIFTYHIEDDYMREQSAELLQEAEEDMDERFPATRQPASSTHSDEPDLQNYLI
jgi:hypothetical protein